MRKRLEKPPVFVYSVFGETGEPDAWGSVFGDIRVPRKAWHVISFSDEAGATKACNALNYALLSNKCHYDNYEPSNQRTLIALAQIQPIDEKARIDKPGALYTIIRYKYDEAKDIKRLPPGVK